MRYRRKKLNNKTLPTIELLFFFCSLIQCCSGQQTIITKKTKYKKLCEIEIISSTNVGYIDLILQQLCAL